ncbi:hypothetical protein BV20DRAFT_974896 [Pilatotrama ljubarskyi]|nr:hypothetical protein BV20DRAFT_974896 [Pilatotrama ljubarskyi]
MSSSRGDALRTCAHVCAFRRNGVKHCDSISTGARIAIGVVAVVAFVAAAFFLIRRFKAREQRQCSNFAFIPPVAGSTGSGVPPTGSPVYPPPMAGGYMPPSTDTYLIYPPPLHEHTSPYRTASVPLYAPPPFQSGAQHYAPPDAFSAEQPYKA